MSSCLELLKAVEHLARNETHAGQGVRLLRGCACSHIHPFVEIRAQSRIQACRSSLRPCYHPAGVSMTNMSGVIQQLKKERMRLEDQLHRITAALTAFGRVYMNGTGAKAVAGRRKGTMSAAARQKISRAQKARWAKQKVAGHAPKPKRTISAAGRKRIAAAQRARWARVKRG
jgi:hypothetical protein